MNLTALAKEIIKLIASGIPGGAVTIAAFEDDIIKGLKQLVSKNDLSALQQFAADIAQEIIELEDVTRPGTARSVSNALLVSIQQRALTFDDYLKRSFSCDALIATYADFKPTDWANAPIDRRELWKDALRLYTERMINYYLTSPLFSARIQANIFQRLVAIEKGLAATQDNNV